MKGTVAKWGNSLVIRIPQHLAQQITLAEGTKVNFDVVDGNLVIKPRQRKHYSLEELTSGITSENLHNEVDTGTSVGNEVW
ncbi:AbrB/MazE/SpoVT family DNA-binding domain-containing protein [Dactylococcopsis salina]|uniref:Growth regulator n=1 Tax=Dactylococcopsis salina (strain PCC 8305) TaxID=13035 RepID=K9YS03_DACS8|nr:AbrB/MazE/SpoVT family DNA-binding domain-containing protein [Dactylococcopsis salina]AFZ49721.1 growth regulator [Dactylococcopsis salina PCC 8305]